MKQTEITYISGAVWNQFFRDKNAEALFTGCHGFNETEPSASSEPFGIFYRVVGLENMTDCGSRGNRVVLEDLPFVNPGAGQPVNANYYRKECGFGVIEKAVYGVFQQSIAGSIPQKYQERF
jgi:hypothetical protein